MNSEQKQAFFGRQYFRRGNYGIPGGYKAYDNDSYWRGVLCSIRKYVEDLDKENYLDLGCAFGYLLKRVPFTHIYGADISRFALAIVKSELQKANRPCNLVLLDADDTHLPFGNGVFGCVTALDIVEHTKDRVHTIREIARIMKKEGVFIVSTPITDTPEGRFWGLLDRDKSHISKPTRKELFADLERSGFEIVEYECYLPLTRQKISILRTDMEVVAIRTDRGPEELSILHKKRFPEASFLHKDEVNK